MYNILVVEDDKEINNLISEFLETSDYQTTPAFSGLEALKFIKEECYQLVLLDLMLPYKSGDEVLKEIRKISNVPVIVISAKSLTQNKVDLLRLGADDYITKPFDLDELLARVESNLRRSSEQKNVNLDNLSIHDLSLDRASKKIFIAGKTVDTTSTEYKILYLLLSNPNKVFTKENLYESVWNEPYFGDDNILNVHISNLRTKLKAFSDSNYIETVWGVGYKIAD